MDFAALYSEYVDAVYGYLAFRLRDKEVVEDLVQETFLAAHQRLDRLQEVASPKAWLLSIAHNKMVDFLRRSQTHQPLHAASLAADGEPAPSTLLVREALLQLEEPEFVDVLRREAALKNALEELKTAMPPEAKVRVLASIQGTRRRAVFQAVARKVLERTLPQAAGPVWEIFERSVLCSEQL